MPMASPSAAVAARLASAAVNARTAFVWKMTASAPAAKAVIGITIRVTATALTIPASVTLASYAATANAMIPALRSAVRTARINGYATSTKYAVTALAVQRDRLAVTA